MKIRRLGQGGRWFARRILLRAQTVLYYMHTHNRTGGAWLN